MATAAAGHTGTQYKKDTQTPTRANKRLHMVLPDLGYVRAQ